MRTRLPTAGKDMTNKTRARMHTMGLHGNGRYKRELMVSNIHACMCVLHMHMYVGNTDIDINMCDVWVNIYWGSLVKWLILVLGQNKFQGVRKCSKHDEVSQKDPGDNLKEIPMDKYRAN